MIFIDQVQPTTKTIKLRVCYFITFFAIVAELYTRFMRFVDQAQSFLASQSITEMTMDSQNSTFLTFQDICSTKQI